MRDKISALMRALRTLGQGLVAAVLLAGGEALNSAVTSGSFDPRFVIMAVATAVVGAAVTFVFNVVAPLGGETGSPSVEGIVRAVRTLVQTVAGVGIVAAWDAVYVSVIGGNYSPADIGKAALAAGLAAVVAYVHNTATTKKASA